ncbi:expressed unknown protein [Seminavis robusta]|uniref:Uncharacterized protein n=1 Tax=Seminavis robusta TaxID=568900 RepID=A0A9N8EGW6_9STRA|nr:expressed unknown protein [Seminavis robusta]|eukprot:Sro1144_g246170.1 n/a (261) ;mRNA; r:32280-33062
MKRLLVHVLVGTVGWSSLADGSGVGKPWYSAFVVPSSSSSRHVPLSSVGGFFQFPQPWKQKTKPRTIVSSTADQDKTDPPVPFFFAKKPAPKTPKPPEHPPIRRSSFIKGVTELTVQEETVISPVAANSLEEEMKEDPIMAEKEAEPTPLATLQNLEDAVETKESIHTEPVAQTPTTITAKPQTSSGRSKRRRNRASARIVQQHEERSKNGGDGGGIGSFFSSFLPSRTDASSSYESITMIFCWQKEEEEGTRQKEERVG